MSQTIARSLCFILMAFSEFPLKSLCGQYSAMFPALAFHEFFLLVLLENGFTIYNLLQTYTKRKKSLVNATKQVTM